MSQLTIPDEELPAVLERIKREVRGVNPNATVEQLKEHIRIRNYVDETFGPLFNAIAKHRNPDGTEEQVDSD